MSRRPVGGFLTGVLVLGGLSRAALPHARLGPPLRSDAENPLLREWQGFIALYAVVHTDPVMIFSCRWFKRGDSLEVYLTLLGT